jgi:hypothetical protein
MLIEQMFFDAVDAQSRIGPPVDVVYVEIEDLLILWG